MASRTKQKEEARARRLAEEQARVERARRQQRIRIIGGTVAIAVVIVVAAVIISAGSGKKGGLQTGTKANATVTTVNQELTGVPQSGAVLGNPKAKVTMTYYGDYQCPVCKDFTVSGGFPQLVANDVRAGKVKVVYASFCTATCNGPDRGVFNTQQVAGLAAGKQNKFWQYTELFYREQGQENTAYVSDKYLQGLAAQITGLNLSQWQADRNDSSLTNQVNADQNTARQIGVSGTPTLIFKGPKGQAVASSAVPTYADLEKSIKQVS
jgi:protein-disulfide isomerase